MFLFDYIFTQCGWLLGGCIIFNLHDILLPILLFPFFTKYPFLRSIHVAMCSFNLSSLTCYIIVYDFDSPRMVAPIHTTHKLSMEVNPCLPSCLISASLEGVNYAVLLYVSLISNGLGAFLHTLLQFLTFLCYTLFIIFAHFVTGLFSLINSEEFLAYSRYLLV